MTPRFPNSCNTSAEDKDSRTARIGLLAIVGAALLLALVRIWAQPPTLATGETAHTWPIVENLVGGRGYSACFPQYFPFCNNVNQATAQREPVPVLIFAGVALLSHSSLVVASLVNVVVYLATLIAIFWLARLFTNRFASLLAAAFWALYFPAIKLITSISGDLMGSLWTVLAVLLMVYALRRGRWYYWVGAGVCVGCDALSRSALVILAPMFIVGVVCYRYRYKKSYSLSRRALIGKLCVFALAVGLTLAPWLVRNAYVFGRPVLSSTLSGYNLYRQNYQLTSPHFLHYVDGPEAQVAIDRLIARQLQLRGTENEAQFDAIYMHAATNIIFWHRHRYLMLTAYRGLMLWFDIGIPLSDQTGTGSFALIARVEQGLLLALAVFGVHGRWKQMWPLVLSIVAVSLSYMAVNAMMRYMVPIMPLTIVLSAIGVASLSNFGFRILDLRLMIRQ